LPKTGPSASGGIAMERGIRISYERLREMGLSASPRIGLLPEDDHGEPAGGVSSIQDAVVRHQASAAIGVVNSSVAFAILHLLGDYKVTLISGGASSPPLSGASPFFFRTCASDLEETQTMARYAFGVRRFDRVAILYSNNAYGSGLSVPFRAAFQALGGSIVAEDTFVTGATDFMQQLAAIDRENPQAVYLVGGPEEIGRCLLQARQFELADQRRNPERWRQTRKPWQFLSASGFLSDVTLKTAGSAAENVVFTDTSFEVENQSVVTKDFVQRYRTKYGTDPEMLAATGFDAFLAMAVAIEASRGEQPEIPDALHNLEDRDGNDVQGAAGPIKFDDKGDVKRFVRFSTVRSGKFAKLQLETEPAKATLNVERPCCRMQLVLNRLMLSPNR